MRRLLLGRAAAASPLGSAPQGGVIGLGAAADAVGANRYVELRPLAPAPLVETEPPDDVEVAGEQMKSQRNLVEAHRRSDGAQNTSSGAGGDGSNRR